MESRESIKKRMLNTAAVSWGLTGGEDETSFDPIVELLITACAAEIEKISRDSEISQSRLMEKLAQVLCPDAQVGAIPAHAIVNATPIEPLEVITPDHQFWFQKRLSEKEIQDIYFTPTVNFPLHSVEVKFLVAKDTLFEVKENRYKEILSKSNDNKRINNSKIFVGLALGYNFKELNNLTFHFELKTEHQKEIFYHYLNSAAWNYGTAPLKSKPGYQEEISGEYLDVQKIIERRTGISDKTAEIINRYYKSRFITVENIPVSSLSRNIPDEILNTFGPKIFEKLKDVVWLELQFSTIIKDDVLKELVVSVNSFPVVNRKYNQFTHRLHETLNIVPLVSNEFFLDLKSVTNTDNRSYTFKEISNNLDLKEGDMILRSSGVGRFDKRDAKELMQYLLEALRDECASYSILGIESITNSIAELNKIITKLEDKVLNQAVHETIPYLLLRSNEANKNLFVEFWSTAGSAANGLKAGMSMESIKGIDLKNRSAILLTISTGGRNRLSDEEKLNIFKGSLISKGQIVTIHDIKTFCLLNLPDKIKRIEIKKGIANGLSRTTGLTRTIDILITPQNTENINPQEWDFIFDSLKTKLQDISFNMFPYRFILN